VFEGAGDRLYGVVVFERDGSVEESPDFDGLDPGENTLQLIFAKNSQSRAASPAWHRPSFGRSPVPRAQGSTGAVGPSVLADAD